MPSEASAIRSAGYGENFMAIEVSTAIKFIWAIIEVGMVYSNHTLPSGAVTNTVGYMKVI